MERFGQFGEKRRYTVAAYLSSRLDLYFQKLHSLLKPLVHYSRGKFADRRRVAKEERKVFGSPWIAVYNEEVNGPEACEGFNPSQGFLSSETAMIIELQPFTEADIDQLMGWVSSEAFLLQWAGPDFSYPVDRSELENELVHKPKKNSKSLIYKIVDAATGEGVGHGEILAIDRRNRSATVGRLLIGPAELRGQGIGEQIVRELLRIAFQELSLHRVALRVLDFNKSAIHCYEKVGFKQEGLLRDVYRMGDEYWSLVVMSILEDGWRSEV